MEVAEGQLEKILIDNNVVSKEKLEDLKTEAEENNKRLQDYILQKKVVSDKELTKMYGDFIGVPYADLADYQVLREVLTKLP